MEGRTRRHERGSPERSRVRSEQTPPPPRQQQPQQQRQTQIGRKIPVVYYLCRNRHLEHPHFIEVPISSPEGLHLRDVINQLNVLRGKCMAAMYSWSCKRSYKNGFVWHDLSEDDLILPASENEYILKGSELLDSSPSGRPYQSPSNNPKLPNSNPKQLQLLDTQLPSRSQESSPCSSSIATRAANQSQPSPPPPPPQSPLRSTLPLPSIPQEDELSPSAQGPSSSSGNASPVSSKRNSSRGSDGSHSPILAECKVYQRNRAVDASTQTEERLGVGRRAIRGREACIAGVSTDDGVLSSNLEESHLNQVSGSKENAEIFGDGIALPPTSSRKSSFVGKTDTLESLIRAEARKMNSFRILEEEDVLVPTVPKLKATNVLMQLITCGSISVKDRHSLGFVHTYRPRFSHANLPSPMFGGSLMVGDLDYFSENPRLMGLRLEDKEYFSGSILETKKLEKAQGGIGGPILKRSSSYNADRICKSPHPVAVRERPMDSFRSNCLPRAIKLASSKVSKSDSMRSPNLEAPRISSEGPDSASMCTSKGSSKRFKDANSVKGSSTRLESFKEDKEKVIKIEERLTSGARVVIQSRAPCDDSEGGSSP